MFEVTDESFATEIAQKGLVLVDFYADWCGPCRALAAVLEQLSQMGTKVVKVNIDECEKTARAFSIRSVPTVILFRDGVQLGMFCGLRSLVDVQTWISATAKDGPVA